MIEFLASIEPASIPLLVVLAFSVSLYPLGLMLGAPCSPCCGQCSSCVEGQLPDTVSVAFSGFEEFSPGPDLITLAIESCFGGSATARVTEPFGDYDTDAGPITDVEVTDGGTGYAVLGRVEPTLTITGDGSGAAFTVTFTSSNDSCGRPEWAITSVTVSDGDDYTDGESLTVTADEDTVEVASASLILGTVREEPSATAEVSGDGSGADISLTLTEFQDDPSDPFGRPYWSITAITITSGGSGYSEFDFISVTVTDGVEFFGLSAYVSAVDGNGAVTAITIDYGGVFYKDSGVPESVYISDGGTYYAEDPGEDAIVAAVTVSVASQSWPSDGTGAAFTATVDDDTSSETFGEITSIAVDDGGDDYLAYELIPRCLSRFDGRTIVLRRFLAGEPFSSSAPLNYSFVDPCLRSYRCAADDENCMVEREFVQLAYNGIGTLATIEVGVVNRSPTSPTAFPRVFAYLSSSSNITNCDNLEIDGEPAVFVPSGFLTEPGRLPEGATATITPGGEYEEPECKAYYIEELQGVKCTIEWNGETFEVEYLGGGDNFADPIGDCGLIGMSYSIVETVGGFSYGGGSSVFNRLRGCRNEWAAAGGISRTSVVGPGPSVQSQYSFDTVGEVPIDEDGYPSGSVTLRGLRDFSDEDPPLAARIDATLTFSRVLP